MDLEITNGTAVVDAPFGALTLTFEGRGELGRDFSAVARLAPVSRPGSDYALANARAELALVSRDETLDARLGASADMIIWDGAQVEGVVLTAAARAPLDLARYDFEGAGRVRAVRSPQFSGESVTIALGAEALARADSLEPSTWEGEGHASAARLAYRDNEISSGRFDAHFAGQDAQGRGVWSFSGDRFAGFALVSDAPGGNGEFNFDLRGNGHADGAARLALSRARLNPGAQQDLRDAFPGLAETPVGPTFAQAEAALDRAADAFDLTAPFSWRWDESGAQITVAAPIEARAASRTVLRLSPLRQDAPAIVLQWPGAALSGAVAVDLEGGGAPTAQLLFDTLDWRPDQPFEADGTLSISQWRAEGASIATEELGVRVAIQPRSGGRIDLTGPARVTGPLGDGEVRDLVATLDLAIAWNAGWRVTPNRGCLPVRVDGLDVAGLSFSAGAFALCPLHGALIAADVRDNLSGGFLIQRLGLNGRMSDAQPARISADAVTAAFSGTSDNVLLALEASRPALTIDMAEGRTLSLGVTRLSANAHIADRWSIDGRFEAGVFTDPTLPGSVSAILGHWSAAPDDDGEGAVIRVNAGEATLTANRPASADERPLFNPLRLVGVSGLVRDGRITADGSLLLAERGRQLARFTAEHDIEAGVGRANVHADTIMFGPDLQPYEISELARGMAENVRGGMGLDANVAWTREDIHATGTLRPLGLNLALSTIPVVQDVRGSIYFDDLFNLTTPPGQLINVGLLNPGVEVRNGRISFQLLPQQRVNIERAEFDFASGTLAVDPTEIKLGADETRFSLSLHGIDAAALVQELNVPDLSATGRIEGAFPLRLTPRSAFVEGGVLRATGGGAIAYTGNAGQEMTGPARVAFDALRSFDYDGLELRLDGDLNGEVVSAISFSGHNSGRPVDVSPIADLPGVGSVTARGVPFHFNVQVHAPFRRLADTAATIIDPETILNRSEAIEQEQQDSGETPAAVDQTGPATR
ncbi:YdbH domain-containing protein [Terricaulis sp.]|uniref:intermembrane phospholipid transport protein YdbH family protein n=1 Tax=Terricaulis sp. TaxID=2768686 RepID=UPI003785318E